MMDHHHWEPDSVECDFKTLSSDQEKFILFKLREDDPAHAEGSVQKLVYKRTNRGD